MEVIKLDSEWVTISPITDSKAFQNAKLKAWEYVNGKQNGFDIDEMDAHNYKYFDRLMQIYGELIRKQISKDDAKLKESEIYKDYESGINHYLDSISITLTYQKNIKECESLMIEMDKVNDKVQVFQKAIRIIGLLVGDKSFESRILKKYGYKEF